MNTRRNEYNLRKALAWAAFFFMAILMGIGFVFTAAGCSTLDSETKAAVSDAVKTSALTAALIGLDLAAADSDEVAALAPQIERDVTGAFEAGGDAKGIGNELANRLLVTVANEGLRAIVQARIRASLTGEGTGQTGADGDPAQMAFNAELAGAL